MTALSEKLREAVNQRINRIDCLNKRELSVPRMGGVDHEMTISFPIQYRQPKENPLAKLRAQSFENDQKISDLRKKLQKEEEQIRQLQKMSLQLTSFAQTCVAQLKETQTEELKPILVARFTRLYGDMVRQHLEFVSEISPSDASDTAALKAQVASLRTQISAAKQSLPTAERKMGREMQRIKAKSRYLQRQYEELDEFVRVEIECERRADEAHIADLNSKISRVRDDIASAREALAAKQQQSKISQLKSALERLNTLKAQIDAKDKEIMQLRAEREEIHAAIDLQEESSQRLRNELEVLEQLTKC